MKFKATVFVRLRANVSDSAGNAVKDAAKRIEGVELDIDRLRLGKAIDLEFHSFNQQTAEEQLATLADRLLANTVIEDWSYEIQEA